MSFLVLIFILLFTTQPVLGQSSAIALFWQDKPIESSSGPKINKSVIYIPIKVLESAGGTIYIKDTEVAIDFRQTDFLIPINEPDDPNSIKIIGDEYHLSIDALAELFNLDVQWNSKEKAIFISEKTIARQVLGLDFNDAANSATLTISHQGAAEFKITKKEPGKWQVDLFNTTLEKPLSWLLIDHPLLYSVRAEQLNRDQVTFHIQGKDGVEVESRLEDEDLVLDFLYTVDSFQYRSIGGLPLLFYESKTGLPEYKEYLAEDMKLVREFSGVRLTGRPSRVDVNDDLIEYFEYYEEGSKVISVIKLRPRLAEFFQKSVQGKRLAQFTKIKSEENDLGTLLQFAIFGSPYFTTKKEGERLIIDFEDTEANNIVRDIKYTAEYKGLTLTKLPDETLRIEVLLGKCKGYVVTQQDNYTYNVQLVKKDLASKLIVIDPGHGGHDPGGLGAFLQEKDLNLDISLRLYDLLTNFGYKAILTRETDLYVSLSERSRLSLSSGADLFISIHTNASTNLLASGIETFHSPNNLEAKNLAELIQKALLLKTQALDRQAKDANFWVLVNNIPHSVLVEIGFITNLEEEKRLDQAEYRQKIAEGVCNGIISFLK